MLRDRAYPLMRGAAGVSVALTMDMALVRELFFNLIDAATALDTDAAFCRRLAGALERLPPYRISSEGQGLEWFEDFADPRARPSALL